MRTKILLLSAAALVAGLTSSIAQSNVYSVNVVGYVNVTPTNGAFTMLANPLNTSSNTLYGLFPTVPGGSTIQIWNGAGFDLYSYTLGHWRQGLVVSDGVPITAGKGFFIRPAGSAPLTNTIAGSVVANVGSSVTNAIPSGLQAVGALIPYSGAVTNTATFNLIVPGGTSLQKWNPTTQGFDFYSFTLGQWRQGLVVVTPSINVGEGFFLNTAAGLNWVQTLPSN